MLKTTTSASIKMFIEYIVLSLIGLTEILFGLFLLYKAKEYRKNRRLKKKYKLADLLAECDPNTPMPEDLKEWDRLKPIGKEIPGKVL